MEGARQEITGALSGVFVYFCQGNDVQMQQTLDRIEELLKKYPPLRVEYEPQLHSLHRAFARAKELGV